MRNEAARAAQAANNPRLASQAEKSSITLIVAKHERINEVRMVAM